MKLPSPATYLSGICESGMLLHASFTALTDPLCGRRNKDKTAMDSSSSSGWEGGREGESSNGLRKQCEGGSRGAKTNVSLVAEPCICTHEILRFVWSFFANLISQRGQAIDTTS